MPVVHVNYLSHIITLTGKYKETIEMRGGTLGDLISELDEKYPGLKDLFIPPEVGILNLRTMVHLMRIGEAARGVTDPNITLKDGDVLNLW